MTTRSFRSGSADATRALGRSLGALLVPGLAVLLRGELGSGKTTFVQGMAAGMGVSGRVASPSFTLVREHANTGDGPGLVHADLYRLRRPAEVADLGLDEYLDDPAVLAVEWPDRGIEVPAARCLVVEFAVDARGRTITISADGALPCAVLTGLAETTDGVPT